MTQPSSPPLNASPPNVSQALQHRLPSVALSRQPNGNASRSKPSFPLGWWDQLWRCLGWRSPAERNLRSYTGLASPRPVAPIATGRRDPIA
ncbi:MAG: hypothetical protein SFZ03_12130 [Candidatus Melainabacteria bacterium]|nr:hypothetical protein [Candidatus Melainabacteria bacterium]